MVTGDFRWRDSSISLATSGGADADNAMKGALVSALKPPMVRNDVLTIQECSEPHQQQLKIKCSLKNGA